MDIQHVARITIAKITTWLTTIIFAQLFLTTVSLPLVIWWGLPTSLLSIVGNIIFNPFIAVFLFCSTLLFFCELFMLPSGLFVWLVERVSHCWLWCVAQGTRHALLALPRPHWTFLCAIALAAVWIMFHFVHRKPQGILVYLALLLAIGCGLRWSLIPRVYRASVPYGSRTLTLVADQRHCFVCDEQGVLRPQVQIRAWADFTLRPQLVTELGRVTCDAIIVFEPTTARLQTAAALAQKMKARYLVVPEGKKITDEMLAHVPTYLALVSIEEKLLRELCEASGYETVRKTCKKVWYTIKNFTKLQNREYHARSISKHTAT